MAIRRQAGFLNAHQAAAEWHRARGVWSRRKKKGIVHKPKTDDMSGDGIEARAGRMETIDENLHSRRDGSGFDKAGGGSRLKSGGVRCSFSLACPGAPGLHALPRRPILGWGTGSWSRPCRFSIRPCQWELSCSAKSGALPPRPPACRAL